jgi:DNA-binding GntR family transcriptional regulator
MGKDAEAETSYARLATVLVEDILGGRWQIGEAMPTEAELGRQFGVSRNTVREALRRLQHAGYIRRRQGARSVLAARSPDKAFVNAASSPGDLLLYVRDTQSRHLATEQILADDRLAELLGGEAGERWVRVSYLRFRDGAAEPICYSEIHVRAEHAPALAGLDGSPTVYDVLERHYGVSFERVEQEIEATGADANLASRLAVAPGTPLLRVRTLFVLPGERLAEVSLTWFPETRYRLRIRLERKPGA